VALFDTAEQLVHAGYTCVSVGATAAVPDDVVDDDDVLVIKTLGITDERRSTLQPHQAVVFVHQTPVVAQRLTFVDHYNDNETN